MNSLLKNLFMKKTEYTIHLFSELYNGHQIDNPTGDPTAIYYTFTIGDRNFLQTHKPNVQWFEPVYSTDIDLIEAHIASLQE